MSQEEPPNERPDEPKRQRIRKPTVADLTKDVVSASEKELEETHAQSFALNAPRSERRFIHQTGLQDHYRHKKKWSAWLLALIISLMMFQSGVVLAVGLQALNFVEYKWLLPALLVQNLAQVVGLAVFVVRSLFKEMKDEP